MESRIAALTKEKNYEQILTQVRAMPPAECGSADMALAIANAGVQKKAYTLAANWYVRHYALSPSDESLGMALHLLLATGQYARVERLLQQAAQFSDGYYYRAGKCQLSFRSKEDPQLQIQALEDFLDIQEEESYMVRLAVLYTQNDRQKEAGRLCRKMGRLFVSGKAVDYAAQLQEQLKDGDALSYIQSHPWQEDSVFEHLSFDPAMPVLQDAYIPAPTPAAAPAAEEAPKVPRSGLKDPKKAKEDRIAPIVESCMKDVIGMQELRVSLTNVFNMMQISRKRVGFTQILKDNLRIYGPDGCGKTTAALTAAAALSQIGITGNGTPQLTDYYTLIGANADETHQNIETLFQNAQNSCIILDNIHEFDDSGAYSTGLEALDQIIKAYHAAGEKIPLIITGSEKETEALLASKKRLADLFNLPPVHLGKYTTQELVDIANRLASTKNLILEDAACELIRQRLENLGKQPDFKFSRDLEGMINHAYIRHSARLAKLRRPSENDYYILKAEDFDTVDSTESVEDLLQQLERLTGLAEVKTQVNKIVKQMQVQKMRQDAGIASPQGHGSLHLVFLGNAGTGKTTVARIIGKIYKRLGVLPTGQLVECTRRDLVSQYVGATAQKVADKVKEAMGGILFIDEAYTLCKDDNDAFGREAIDALLADIENHRDNLMVILAGYDQDMQKFMDQNQGLRSRIPTDIHFADYSTEEMVDIFKMNVKNRNFILDVGLEKKLYELIDERKRQKNFGNARGVRNLFEEILLNQDARLGSMDPSQLSKNDFLIIRDADIPQPAGGSQHQTVNDYLQQLEQLTGLAEVKVQVSRIVKQMQVQKMRQEAGIAMPQGHGSLHLVFLGNAGTGKTTVARLIGSIYRELGVLSTGQLVECTRRDLVSQYVGATSQKVADKVKEAMGGILFIDEAYTLCKDDNDSYGREAIDALLTDIENHRDDLMVILAGYDQDMQKFMDQNQGLRSRIPTDIFFADYSTEEMTEIFKMNVKNRGMQLGEGAEQKIHALIDERKRQKNFGNARGVRNLFEAILLNQDTRLSGMDPVMLCKQDFLTIQPADIPDTAQNGANNKGVSEYLDELNAMTGLAAVKDKVKKIVSTVEVNQAMAAMGLSTQAFGTLHMVFKGNAGTGKTTVARLIGSIYRELGVLSSGHLVEVDRSALVGQYVGTTAPKVKAKVQEAMGGILFIDEAYALAKGGENDYGKEAIDTLVADIENYRKDLMVIIAGYSEDMDVFLAQNQGLRSRFPNEILFEDYTTEELLSIFKGNLKSRGLFMDPSLEPLAARVIAYHAGGSDFGNARGIRNLVDQLCEQRNVRIASLFRPGFVPTKEDLQTITAQDIQYLL